MKGYIFTAIIALSLCTSFLTPIFAHELIPVALQEYLSQNPDATPEEIKAFADEQTPEFSEKFKDGAAIIILAQNQETSFIDNVFDFFKLGVHHILEGLDHILFVLSLILIFVSIREILKLTVTFTIAHSVTLILSGAGIIALSPRITEPLIAISIAYVALTTVFLRNNIFFGSQKAKIGSVFFFGLFHGLGFAGLLKEIQVPDDKFLSSLLSFNIGIEIGQLIIISITLPIIFLCRKKSWYPTFIKIFAVCIAALALFWSIERIFSSL